MTTENASNISPQSSLSKPENKNKTSFISNMEYKENVIDFLSGAIGGTTGLIFGHPLDTIKTITQNSTKKISYSEGIIGIGQHGYKTFYRGLSLPLCSYGLVNACLFTSYKFAQRIMDPKEESTRASAVCGAFAGLVQLIPGTPIEVIKIQMQQDTVRSEKVNAKGPMSYIRNIVKTDGLAGLYKGFGIHALRDVPAFLVYFYSYKTSNELCMKYQLTNNATIRCFIGGAVAGTLSWILMIPIDVLKTRIQAKVDRNIIESIRALRKIGIESFFRGGTILTLRALLVNSITFVVFEKCSRSLEKL